MTKNTFFITQALDSIGSNSNFSNSSSIPSELPYSSLVNTKEVTTKPNGFYRKMAGPLRTLSSHPGTKMKIVHNYLNNSFNHSNGLTSLLNVRENMASGVTKTSRPSRPLIVTRSLGENSLHYNPPTITLSMSEQTSNYFPSTINHPIKPNQDFTPKSATKELHSLLQSHSRHTSRTQNLTQRTITEDHPLVDDMDSSEDDTKQIQKQTHKNHIPISRFVYSDSDSSFFKYSSNNRNSTLNQTLVNELDIFLSRPIALSKIHQEHQPVRMFPPPLPPLSVSYTHIQRLAELVKRRSYLDVIEYSSNLLISSGNSNQINTPYSKYYNELTQGKTNEFKIDKRLRSEACRIIRWRLLAFLRLRMYKELLDDIKKMNFITKDSFDNRNSTEINMKSIPLWVDPRIIVDAVLSLQYLASPPCCGYASFNNEKNNIINPLLCTDALYNLRREWLDDPSKRKRWILPLDVSLSDAHCYNNEWRISLQRLDVAYTELKEYISAVLYQYYEEYDDGAGNDLDRDNLIELVQRACAVELFSRQGRVLLQSGMINGAQKVFDRVILEYSKIEKLQMVINSMGNNKKNQNDSSYLFDSSTYMKASGNEFLNAAVVTNLLPQISINAGLLYFAHNEYNLAIGKFREAVELYSSRKTLPFLYDERRTIIDDLLVDGPQYSESDRLVSCWNNIALGFLYQGRIRDSISILESVIKLDPTTYLTHSTTFNLCTLYELANDSQTGEEKKNILKLLANRFCLHDLSSESFRI